MELEQSAQESRMDLLALPQRAEKNSVQLAVTLIATILSQFSERDQIIEILARVIDVLRPNAGGGATAGSDAETKSFEGKIKWNADGEFYYWSGLPSWGTRLWTEDRQLYIDQSGYLLPSGKGLMIPIDTGFWRNVFGPAGQGWRAGGFYWWPDSTGQWKWNRITSDEIARGALDNIPLVRPGEDYQDANGNWLKAPPAPNPAVNVLRWPEPLPEQKRYFRGSAREQQTFVGP